MDRNPQIGEDYWERYLDIVGCRPVSEWLGLHIWLPRWGALGWCSSEFSSGSLSHSGCYTPTTRSMSTSLRSLPQQNKNQKFIWINLKCLAESKELAFDIHYAFFPLVRTERERENNVFCCSGYLCTIAMALETMAKSISLITAQEFVAEKPIAALDF